jgi:hypothetical protein
VSKFKAGDKVRYVKEGALDWESCDWADRDGCVLGDVYTVNSAHGGDNHSVILADPPKGKFLHISVEHFELANEEPARKFKVGDIVRTVGANSPYWGKGHIGKVFREDSDGTYWVDFNYQGNEFVYDDGMWCVSDDEAELCEPTRYSQAVATSGGAKATSLDLNYTPGGFGPSTTVSGITSTYGPKDYAAGIVEELTHPQAKRYNANKPPLSYLLYWPKAIEAIANVCREGEKKYERFNYKKGAPVSQYMDSGLRHQTAFINGEDLDQETQCYHLAMDIWNKLQALEVMLTPEMKERFDDRYKKEAA